MAIFQSLTAYRDELALGIGRAAAFGKPFDLGGPEKVLGAPAGAFDQGFHLFLGDHREPSGKSLVI